jgi:DNA helicase-2/ATP-dependent DNA helicase PcrA
MSTGNPKDLEEERRLFYVALTRAEKTAVISYAELRYKWGIQNSCSPSRFIKEIDAEYLELPPDFYPVIPQADSPAKEKFVPENYRKIMERRSQPRSVDLGGRKLTNVNQATGIIRKPSSAPSSQPPKDFTPSDPTLVREGISVEHPRFGIGKVTMLEGADSNIKATVQFPSPHGRKQLLLKFAKLRVVE